jgi:hypothetical protein
MLFEPSRGNAVADPSPTLVIDQRRYATVMASGDNV